MKTIGKNSLFPFFWKKDNLFILDQRKLPLKKEYVKCNTYQDVVLCIKNMIVRGAPAIGLVGGYGVVLAVKDNFNKNLEKILKKACDDLISSRPTAYNLSYIVGRMKDFILKNYHIYKKDIYEAALGKMEDLRKENYDSMLKIAKYGASLIKKNSIVLTHCNTGPLACGDIGTALGVIIEAHRQGKIKEVYVDETRPYLQGARLTMLELQQAKVPCTLITDNMAAYVIKEKKVNCIIVGADRIASNGDTANKIGTYSLAIIAKYHNIPLYVAAPTSTIDINIKSSKDIIIEYRPEDEVKYINNKLITVKNAKVLHPAFDITPSELVSAIITEKGIFKYPYKFYN